MKSFPNVSPAQLEYLSDAQKMEMMKKQTPMGAPPISTDELDYAEESDDDEYHHDEHEHGHGHAEYLSDAQRQELKVTPAGNQKRGYHNVRGQRGYSDSMGSHSSSQHSQRMNQFQVPAVSNLDAPRMPLVNQSSEDSLMNEMQTSGWIAGDSGVFGSSSSVHQQQGQIHQDLQQGQYQQQQQQGQYQQQQGLPAPEDRQHFHGGTHSSIPNLPPSTRPSGKNTMVSEHGDVLSQDIVHYVETDDGIQAAEVELEMENDHVSPQHDGYQENGGPDHEMYNVAAKITIGTGYDNDDDEYGDNGGNDDDIYGDPNKQGDAYENEYYDDEDDDDMDDIETM